MYGAPVRQYIPKVCLRNSAAVSFVPAVSTLDSSCFTESTTAFASFSIRSMSMSGDLDMLLLVLMVGDGGATMGC